MKRYLWMGMFFVLVACGNPSEFGQVDTAAPLLSISLPETGSSDVPTNVKLAFGFNEAIDEASLTLSATPTLNLGSPTWTSDHKNVIFANEVLSPSTSYSLLLSAKDLAGNALASTALTFTTSASTDTTVPSTPNNLIASPGNTQVSLSWQASPEADVVGYTIFLGTTATGLKQHSFVPETSSTITGLDNGKAYFFALDAVDGAGNHSSQSGVVSVTPSATDITAPTLQSSDPTDNATGINIRPIIKLVFSEPMDTASLNLILLPPNSVERIVVEPSFFPSLRILEPLAIKPFTVTWSEADTVATLTLEPSGVLLLEETEFTLTLSAKDKAGNILSGDNDISFSTGFEVPTLVSSIPTNGASDIRPGVQEIVLTFSEGVMPGTFEINSNFPCLVYKSETVSPIVRLSCASFDGNTYTLSYEGQDLDLHEFKGSLSFSTVPDTIAPSVLTTSPNDLAVNIALNTSIKIMFDDEMDDASTVAAISSSPDVGCAWSISSVKDAFECSSANLQGSTTYTITVAETATDTSGNKLSGSGLCRGGPPCAYSFSFTTLTPLPPTGNLQLNITGLPLGQKRVRVIGPNGFNSGLLDEGTSYTNLPVGDYSITAANFVIAPGKPACRIYTATPSSQTLTVSTNQTRSATVSYTNESCAL